MTVANICSGFAATGLVPFDLERVLSKLDPIIQTPSPILTVGSQWESKTPHIVTNIERQARYIREQR